MYNSIGRYLPQVYLKVSETEAKVMDISAFGSRPRSLLGSVDFGLICDFTVQIIRTPQQALALLCHYGLGLKSRNQDISSRDE